MSEIVANSKKVPNSYVHTCQPSRFLTFKTSKNWDELIFLEFYLFSIPVFKVIYLRYKSTFFQIFFLQIKGKFPLLISSELMDFGVKSREGGTPI